MFQPYQHAPARGRLALRAACGRVFMVRFCLFDARFGSGPSTQAVQRAGKARIANADIKIIEVTDAVARQVIRANSRMGFSEMLGDAPHTGNIVGRGDVLEVTIWEFLRRPFSAAKPPSAQADQRNPGRFRGLDPANRLAGDDGR